MKKSEKNYKKNRKSIIGITMEFMLLVLLVVIVIGAVIGYSGLKYIDKVMQEKTNERIRTTCFMARDMIDGDNIDMYLENDGDNELANDTRAKLQSICNNCEFNFLYVIYPDFPNSRVLYYVTVKGEMYPELDLYKTGDVTVMSVKAYQDAYKALLAKEKDFDLIFRTGLEDKSKDHITGVAPIYNSDGEVVAIMSAEISANWYSNPLDGYINSYLLHVIIAGIVIVVICIIFVWVKIARPIKNVCKEIDRFSKERDLQEDEDRISVKINSRNEIGILADTVDRLEEKIVDK